MTVVKIRSDNPKADQWKSLGQFFYPTNITRYFADHSLVSAKETIDYIAGCIRQSEAYFNAAETSPLDISPLLIYYGATNLLAGTAALLTGNKSPIWHHGMNLHLPSSPNAKIGDYQIKPVNPTHGALQNFCNVFANGCAITTADTWTVEEAFSGVPDLIPEFETCYHTRLPSCVPVVPMKGEIHGLEFYYDRMDTELLQKYPKSTLSLIPNYSSAYLIARYNNPSKFVKLYYKPHALDIGIYSIFGQKYLPIAYIKSGRPIWPTQLLLMYMALYALGYVSRYHPERWNPFIRTDETGERLVIEKFLSISQRYFPNLVLNEIKRARVQFVYKVESETMLD